MSLTIAQRQYLAFLALTLIVLLMTLGLANWNFESGFTTFIEDQEQQRLTSLGEDLLEEFERADGQWARVDPRLLNRLLSPRRFRSSLRPGREPGQEPGRGLGKGPRRGPSEVPRNGPGNEPENSPGARPAPKPQAGALGPPGPPPGPPPGRRQGKPGGRGGQPNPPTALFDQGGRYIAGALGLEGDVQNVVIPLVMGGQTVAELRSLPRRQFQSPEESQFVQRQRTTKWIIGSASLLVAAIIAYLLSASIQRPIRRMTGGITDLSNGNYDTRLKTTRTDELGRLMNDLDRLATTLGEGQTARRRWLADISHELRTPLAALTAEIEALKDGVRTFSAERLASLDAQTTRLRRLVDDLYELSLSDVGGMRYSYEPLELVAQLSNVVGQVRDRAEGIEINLVVPESLHINADPLRIDQLLNNLLANAITYTDAPGSIDIRLKRQGGRAILEISDTPPGVIEQECERLFEPLYRRESARDRYRGGAGLGLAICKNIADAHQASIRAYPAETGGLCVRIDFPMMRG